MTLHVMSVRTITILRCVSSRNRNHRTAFRVLTLTQVGHNLKLLGRRAQ